MVLPKPKTKKKLVIEEARHAVEIVQPEADHPDVRMFEVDGDAIQAQAQRLMKLSLFEPEFHYRLDTGSPDLNAVWGSRDSGIAYGKLYEISGPEHTGKTLISTVMLGMAQRDGAAAGYIDLEESRDGLWAAKLGANWPAVTKFYPQLVMPTVKRDKKWTDAEYAEARRQMMRNTPPKLLSAEEICEQAEKSMFLLNRAGAEKQFWFLDSVAMMITAKQEQAGLSGSNMNTKNDRAMMLSTMLPRWAGLAANYNAIILLSNQLRSRIGGFIMPGMEDETTGGKALRHACSVRIRTRRVKGGRLKNGTTVVGLAGALRNIKNKSGEGSVEGCECGFKVLWNRPQAQIEFMSIKDLKEDLGEE